MRFMMLLKADKITETGQLPTRTDLEVMGKYNEELVKAGVLVDAAGLQPSSKGAKVTFRNGRAQVTEGPFADIGDLVAGYWVIRVKSKAEAIAWARRVPFQMLPSDGRPGPEIELRQVYELADFADVPAEVEELEQSFDARRAGQRR